MHHIFFIYSSVDEHLGCFHVLAVVNRIKDLNVRSAFIVADSNMARRLIIVPL